MKEILHVDVLQSSVLILSNGFFFSSLSAYAQFEMSLHKQILRTEGTSVQNGVGSVLLWLLKT